MTAESSRACPNCKYIRKATDTAPDWQCPSCNIAYNKAGSTNRRKPRTKKKPISILLLKITLIACIAAVAIKAYKHFDERSDYSSDRDVMVKFISKWDDAEDLAKSTAKIALAPAVSSLQQLSRDWVDIAFKSACVKATQVDFSVYAERTIQGYIAFMANQDYAAQTHFKERSLAIDTFQRNFEACNPDNLK